MWSNKPFGKSKTRVRKSGRNRLASHINNQWETWAQLWREQVSLGLIPYYMFIARDTGAKPFLKCP